MNKTTIETVGEEGYTWNPVTGCTRGCWFCYARDIAHRWNPEDGFKPTFHENRLNEPKRLKKPSLIMVCSMGDIHDSGITDEQLCKIIDVMKDTPQHTYQVFTKRYYNHGCWHWPENAWLGYSVYNRDTLREFLEVRNRERPVTDTFKPAKTFLYIEPLLQRLPLGHLRAAAEIVDWIVVGALTGRKAAQHKPKLSWVEDIITAAREFNVPVFLKPTIPLASGGIQEWPEGMKPKGSSE